MRLISASTYPFRTRLLITALIAITAGLLIGLGIRFVRAQGDGEAQSACQLGGSASFLAAQSISDLASRADAVIKGKIIGVRKGQDQYGHGSASARVPYVEAFVIYDVAVEEVLAGTVPEGKSLVSLGLSFTLCLDTGAMYYMFVHNENVAGRPYADSGSTYQVPAGYSLAWFGPANVMEVRSGNVVFLSRVGQQAPGSTMKDSEFRRLLRE